AGPIRDLEGDVFLARLADDGSTLDFSTYLGGRQDDQATGLALDTEGTVYLTGTTMSGEFPTTPGAWQTERQGLKERFVARLVPLGGSWMLDESTRLGAPGGFETGRAGLAVDRAGRVWIAGATASEQFPIREAEQSMYGGGESDAFLARMDASGMTLGYASYLGGSEADVVTALALGNDALCVTGGTGSADFPTQAALQPAFDGPFTAGRNLSSVFVTCFEVVNEASVLTRIAVAPDSVGLIAGETVHLAAEGFDQFEQALSVDVTWTATGGTIDSTGRYTAGDDAGLFAATATTPDTGIIGTSIINIISGVANEDAADVPDAFALHGNYPNPFNPQTTIRFDVKAAARVVLTIYDVLGRKQATLVEKDYAPGRYAVRFDGRGWPSGTYFYVIEMSASGRQRQAFRAAQKMVLLR
ncbi:MAG TPA: SBBP repeat-containing protein, partial [Rhodothermales bacterium]|nr:SBBP repeat-containing protein [Rhodothermales bacterium]